VIPAKSLVLFNGNEACRSGQNPNPLTKVKNQPERVKY